MSALSLKARNRSKKPLRTICSRYVRSSSVVSGRLSTQVELKEVDDSKDDRSKLTIDDFAIDNIIGVGATHMLKPVSLTNDNIDGVVGMVEDAMNSLIPKSNE